MNAADTKDAVKNAFKALRKQNLIARMNFLCCSSCAGYEISEMMKKKRESGKPVDGYVFYHRQDGEAFAAPRRTLWSNNNSKPRTLHLRYGCEDLEELADENADIDPDTWKEDDNKAVAIGKKVVAALKAEGLDPVWDENPDVTIQVNFEV